MNLKSKQRRIGIFGGSFDPVHNGHTRVVQSFLKSGLIDEILLLLTPDPPHKDSGSQIAYNHRFNMLKLAFAGEERVEVSDLETRLPAPSWTLQTLQYLQRGAPRNHYFLCLGEDSIATFHDWHRYKEILGKVTLLVAERPGFDHKQVAPYILDRTIFVEHEPVEISSTRIREHQGGVPASMLPQAVLAYIQKHGLYA